MTKYYFVVYENKGKVGSVVSKSNVILKDIHPVLWAANPGVAYEKHWTTKLLYWTPLPERVALDESVKLYFGLPIAGLS